MGMQFGLWFEPEMISQDSQLYREHPDYVLHAQGRPYTIGRGQLVLDLSRKDVCDHVIDSVRAVLASTDIDYVKWDMNRHLTEVESGAYAPCQQGEIAHRYVLGLYYILETLTSEFPDILFEGCSSGGGRFDAGMLYYMPQSWCSDNTDAVCRMKIQYATSLTFPPVTMGAHVSVVPNQQTGRVTPLETRGYLARNFKNARAKELCIPSFISVLFGITEPALFGINLRYRYPLIGGCLGGAVGGAIVYFTNLAALGFGTTVVPGIALADPAGNGYINYIVAHVVALAAGFLFTLVLSAAFQPDMEGEGICGAIMLAAAGIFLVAGFLFHAWHPAWIVFPLGGILRGIVSSLRKHRLPTS